MMVEPHWTAYVSAMTLPVIAAFGAWIAFKQWQTNQRKLQLELFEKRYAIYFSAKEFVSNILRSGSYENLDLVEFLQETRQAKWILSSEIQNFLEKEIYHKAIDLQMYEFQLKDLGVGDDRTEKVRASTEIKKQLLKIHEPMDKLFERYLQLKH
ncbi:hypothetical protein [Shewanella oncorhynchi]|uniref:hypothetical protein n=1 Tax=Shewanella oncorhynchi TaxID=2726434 RepID=UPI002E7B2177|nr:hypothetical protein [Shewanella oncorhynchi]WVI92472.1 hypothetical protein VR487_16820 [Shewanella oncorhynchi]